MLTAAFLRTFALAAPSARPLGLVGASAGLWSRAQRRRADWADHEAACHAIVRRAMAGLPQRRTVVVLGSGLCRDIPLPDLAHAFDRVILVDAVHLPPVRLAARRLDPVSLDARDISGLADWLVGRSSGPVDVLADLITRPDIDLVISANVLSQLPIGLEDGMRHDEERPWPTDLPAEAIRRHLTDLRRFAGRVCLLTDIRAIGRGTDIDLLHGETLPTPDAVWFWPVQADIVHTVHGYADFAAALR